MKLRNTVLSLVLFFALAAPALAQKEGDVVISEYSSTVERFIGATDTTYIQMIELMVVNGPVDMRKWFLTENSAKTDSNVLVNPYNEATMVFQQDKDIWNNIPSGTIITFYVGRQDAIANSAFVNDTTINQKTGDFEIVQAYKKPGFLMNTNTPYWQMSSTYGDNFLLVKDNDDISFNGFEKAIDAVYYVDLPDTAGISNKPLGIEATLLGPGNYDNAYYFNSSDLTDLGNNDASKWVAYGSVLANNSFGLPNKDSVSVQNLAVYRGTMDTVANLTLTINETDSTLADLSWDLPSGWSNKVNDVYVVASKDTIDAPSFKDLKGKTANSAYGTTGTEWENGYILYAGDDTTVSISNLLGGAKKFNFQVWTVKDTFLYYTDTYASINRIPEVIDTTDTTIAVVPSTETAKVYQLAQNYPNPFNPSTTIKFSIAQAGLVKLSVYNILGERVADLVNETMNAGEHTVRFDASNLPSGIYIYKIQSGNFTRTNKMLLIK